MKKVSEITLIYGLTYERLRVIVNDELRKFR